MRLGTVVALVLCVTAPSVQADSRDVAREAARRAVIRYDIGEYKEALELFKEAYLNFDDASLLFNIAQCYRQLDDKPNAIRIYRSYLIKLPKAPNRDEVRTLIAKLEKLEQEEHSTMKAPPQGTLRTPPTVADVLGPRPSPAPPVAVAAVSKPPPAKPAPKPEPKPEPKPLPKPEPKPAPVASKPAPVASKPAPVAAPLTVTASRPERRTPVYRKWWLWTTVGLVVAAGVGVGVGLGLTMGQSQPALQAPTTFGTAHPF